VTKFARAEGRPKSKSLGIANALRTLLKEQTSFLQADSEEMTLIADTSGLLAAINRRDAAHESVRRAIESETLIVVPELVIAEVDYMLLSHLGMRQKKRLGRPA